MICLQTGCNEEAAGKGTYCLKCRKDKTRFGQFRGRSSSEYTKKGGEK